MNLTDELEPVRKPLPWQLLAAVALYLLVLLRWGYEYGRNDQMQVLAYALFLDDPTLYPHDFFIQRISAVVPNERYFFSLFLSWLVPVLEPVCLVLHALFGVLLFYLSYRLASRFIKNDYLCWVAVSLPFLPLYNISLGSNELYYNTFFVSNPVKALGLLALTWRLNGRNMAAFALLAFLTLLQPVNGVQLFVTFSGMLVLGRLSGWYPHRWRDVFWPIALYSATALVYLLVLQLHFNRTEVNQNLFFRVLFEFRAPHHYLPTAFPLKYYAVLAPLFLLGAWYYYRHHKGLLLFFAVSFLGFAVYAVAVEVFHSNTAAALQWFKTAIWLKLFSCIALVALVEQLLPQLQQPWLRRLGWTVLLSGGLVAMVVLGWFRQRLPWPVTYDFLGTQLSDPAVDIAVQARKLTPKDAFFIHPIAFTELKYYGQRSAFVDYKVLVHRQDELLQWHERIRELYGVSVDGPYHGFGVYIPADVHFAALTEADLQGWHRKYGITHLLTWRSHQLRLPVVAENEKYRIYSLP